MNKNDKSMFERKEYFSSLLSLYGELLPKTIKERMMMFYLDDYSITEIAQNENVSRTAIFESIKTGESKLDEYESKLKMVKFKYDVLKHIEEISNTEKSEEKNQLLEKWKGEIENGI